MPHRDTRSFLACALSVIACGAATPPAESSGTGTSANVAPPRTVAAPNASAAPEPVKKPEPAPTVPTACADGGGDMCTTGAAFAGKVCDASQPDLPLVLFAKGSPWTRLYLKGDVDAWNAEGGAAARSKLAFDEEVIVLKRRTPPKGSAIVIGSGGGYQVMRWDGNCYSLDEGEVTTRRPPKAKHPILMWKYLTLLSFRFEGEIEGFKREVAAGRNPKERPRGPIRLQNNSVGAWRFSPIPSSGIVAVQESRRLIRSLASLGLDENRRTPSAASAEREH